jgi:hypothetical protein
MQLIDFHECKGKEISEVKELDLNLSLSLEFSLAMITFATGAFIPQSPHHMRQISICNSSK